MSSPARALRPQGNDGEGKLPPLEPGDRLDQKTFHARYEAMPRGIKAELIGGVVHMPSPLRRPHGRTHIWVIRWLGVYEDHTPGVESFDNTTNIMGPESEPQPDVCLLISPEHGGQTRDEDGYIVGAPELVVEVASSSESIDLHAKLADYERGGVREYVVVVLRRQQVLWFVRQGGRFVPFPADPDGIFRSRVFPGLWLDPVAVFQGNINRLTEVVLAGVATPEHAAFVAHLTSPGQQAS